MYIEELKEGVGGFEIGEEQSRVDLDRGAVVPLEVKRALVGAGGRALFYPTLLYNVVRNKIQSGFRWWDRVDEVYYSLPLLFHCFSFNLYFEYVSAFYVILLWPLVILNNLK